MQTASPGRTSSRADVSEVPAIGRIPAFLKAARGTEKLSPIVRACHRHGQDIITAITQQAMS